MESKTPKGTKDLIIDEYEKGNIVYMGIDGIMVSKLSEFVKQPVEGILYDLNKLEEVVLTFINDPKWINDYAVAKVIRELKKQVEELVIKSAHGKEGGK